MNEDDQSQKKLEEASDTDDQSSATGENDSAEQYTLSLVYHPKHQNIDCLNCNDRKAVSSWSDGKGGSWPTCEPCQGE